MERSSDQVIKPINTEALTKWVGNIPKDIVRDIDKIAPMLAKLGYDPHANPPNYGSPDTFVMNNTKRIQDQEEYWNKLAMNMFATSPEPTEAVETETTNDDTTT